MKIMRAEIFPCLEFSIQQKKNILIQEYSFVKIYYWCTLQDKQKIRNLYEQGDGEVALSLYSSLSKVKSPIVFLLVQ